jgi:hypothetical protein
LNQSPFNQIAINRWLETGEEDVRNQKELRANLMSEATLNGAFINRQILLINDFPSLQRLLVDPSIETVMVLVTVNRNNGLDYYARNVLEEFLNNPPQTTEEKRRFPTRWVIDIFIFFVDIFFEIDMYACTNVCMYVCTNVCMYVYMYESMYV